ncbi:hypothetical protein FRB98_000612 [Tulasnella sp. 332]|nr:hypothetical protein FRB98_000612 [Tulasnella sp. 332]
MPNPEASSSKVSVASATLPAYSPPGIPPSLGSFKLSAAERLDDLRPGLEYIQQYLTENGWALEEFLTRAQKESAGYDFVSSLWSWWALQGIDFAQGRVAAHESDAGQGDGGGSGEVNSRLEEISEV